MPDPSDLTGIEIVLQHSYLVEEPVHRGPMATLYSARWNPLGVPVFIRSYESLIKLRLKHKDTTQVKQNLVSKAPQIRGKGLPDLIDVGEEDATRPFLVMRLPAGELLMRRLQDEGRLGVGETAGIISGLVEPLSTLRAGDLPHRGPMPNRVWVGNEGEVVLLGAGEVLYRDETVSMSGPARTELVWHMPPECFAQSLPDPDSEQSTQMQGHALEDNPRAEVYALGCLAYHCLNGHHPFFLHRGDPSEGIFGTIKDTPLDLKGLDPEGPVAAVVFRALSRNPKERFESPEEFASALVDAAGVAPVAVEDHDASKGRRKVAPTTKSERRNAAEAIERRQRISIRLWRASTIVLLLGLLGYAGFDYLRPHSVVITSNPPGLELAEVVGHTTQPRGTTPLILDRRNLQVPIELQVIAPNGEVGPPARYAPREFQDLGRCRRLEVELTFPE